MQHNHAEIPKWPKTEPEDNLHDVISQSSGTNVGRFQRLRDILTTFGPELKKQTIIMVERAKFTYNKKNPR